MLFELLFTVTRSILIVVLLSISPLAIAQGSGNPKRVLGNFSPSKAMRAVYGNYSLSSHSSTISDLSDYAPDLGKRPGTVRVMLNAPYSEHGVNYRVLATYAVPLGGNFNCHPCAPSVSVFLFEQHEKDWLLKSTGYDLFVGGSLGIPTPIRLVQIGPSSHGLLASWSYIAQGDVTAGTTIFLPSGSNFAEVFDLDTAFDNLANCKQRDVDCSSVTTKFEFIRNPNVEIWNIRVKTTEVLNGKVLSGTEELYRFANGKYVQPDEQ